MNPPAPADRFVPVLGRERGLSRREAGAVAPTRAPDPDHGARGEDVARLLDLIETLPLPAITPGWLRAGVEKGFIRHELLQGSDVGLRSKLDDLAHAVWRDCHGESLRSRSLPAVMCGHIAIWMVVFPDALTPDQRSFLRLAWRTLQPTVELP